MTFVGEHQNHLVGELAGQPLDAEVISKIKELVLDNGLRNSEEVKTCLKPFLKTLHPDCPTTNRRFHPTSQDIRNHLHQALRTERYSDNDQENVQKLMKSWEEQSPNDKFYFRPASSTDDYVQTMLWIHQTQFQRRLLAKFGSELALLDATYKTCKYSLPLYFLTVMTGAGYMVVASFIISAETTKAIQEGLEIIKEWNNDWHPQSFMCDLDEREINALESCFTGCKVFTCLFHREQAWSRWLKKFPKQKDEATRLLRNAAEAGSTTEYNENVEALKSCALYKANKQFEGYVNKYWLRNKERWVRLYRKTTAEVYVRTTNGVEAANKTLKYHCLDRGASKKSLTNRTKEQVHGK